MALDFCDAFIRSKSVAFPNVIERKRDTGNFVSKERAWGNTGKTIARMSSR